MFPALMSRGGSSSSRLASSSKHLYRHLAHHSPIACQTQQRTHVTMASSDVLTETLHTVTGIKLAQLEKQKTTYENAKRALLADAEREADGKKRARMLIDGAQKLPAMMTPLNQNPNLSMGNFRSFVEQAECDPSVSATFLTSYEETIRSQLDAQSNKYSFATLYGQLVKDWTSTSRDATTGSDVGAEFVAVGREEMYKQRATWEEYVFEAKETDGPAIEGYLDELFAENSSKEVKNAFETLRKDLKRFQDNWDGQTHFDKDRISQYINTILRGDVISDQKRTTLNEFLGNGIVLSEIADVLNMRMSTRKDFAWDSVTTVEQRRQLNGRYRFFPDEDLLQTIFLQCIGLVWATELRRVLTRFVNTAGVLKPTGSKLSKQAARRRRFFLGDKGAKVFNSVEFSTRKHWREKIFMDQLPAVVFEKRASYGNDKEEGEEGDSRGSPLSVVQKLVHRIQASVTMRQQLGQETAVVRSDFRWFGPSLPHSSIFAVLKYFGVQEDWLVFFRKVLEAPMAFKDEDGVGEPRIRRRGTPIGTSIGTFLGEAVLFCSDFAVNQKANGTRLYRLHDDLWLWGDVDTCSQGWTALTEFTDIMGLAFNEDKTGSCVVRRRGTTEASVDASTAAATLPQGDVVWGFLKLDSGSGRFVINQNKVDSHIEELQLQLNACRSVFDFVQAWNLYGVRFFRTYCGKVARCFGRRHVGSMLETFKQIQARVFSSSSGSVGQHLKDMIEQKLGVTGVPDGFLYFPTSMGGLGLQNPFIDLYMIRDRIETEPEEAMTKFLELEKSRYRSLQREFEKAGIDSPDDGIDDGVPNSGNVQGGYSQPPGDWSDLRDEPFMSFEEFTQQREITSQTLGHVYNRLLEVPSGIRFNLHGEVLQHAQSEQWADEYSRGWTPYERWVVQLYSGEIMSRFGSLNIVEEGLLPIGLMKMLTQSRFKWQN